MITVELLGVSGNDRRIAQAAWASTNSQITPQKQERIPAFVRRLWLERHETPFEKVTIDFIINMDIASHIQFLKHRIAVSINTESARYKELKEDKYYIPNDWPEELQQQLESATAYMNDLYHYAIKVLEPIYGRQRAKESARYFKLYNSEIQSDVTFNLRSLAHFMFLRNSPHAQLEIQTIAQKMWDLVSKDTSISAAIAAIEERNKWDAEYHSSHLLKI